jgi:hypothetical protein
MSWGNKIPSDMSFEEVRKAALWVRVMMQGGPLRLLGYQAHEAPEMLADTSLPNQIGERSFSLYRFTTTPQGGLQIAVDLSTSALLKANTSVYDTRQANLGNDAQQKITDFFNRLSGSGNVQLDASIPDQFLMRLNQATVRAASQEFDKAIAQGMIRLRSSKIIIDGRQNGIGHG